MKHQYEFPFNLIMEFPWHCLGLFGMIVVYKWLKAWQNPDGSVGYKSGKTDSQYPPNELAKNFKKHHSKNGAEVDVKPRKDGFDGTVTDIFGNEEHYEVRKSRKK